MACSGTALLLIDSPDLYQLKFTLVARPLFPETLGGLTCASDLLTEVISNNELTAPQNQIDCNHKTERIPQC
jgi:hypothetical protein